MRFLADTNILTCLAQPGHPQHVKLLAALAVLRERGDEACVVPQNIYEFWVVGTRPTAQNGLGMSVARIQTEVAQITRLFTLLRDERAIFGQWHRLVATRGISGKRAHDARLVAAMLRHGLGHILTFNPDDFRRYPEITVLTPGELVPSSAGA